MTAGQPPAPTRSPAAQWRSLWIGVTLAVIGAAAFLGAAVFLVGRADWWRGYVAATVAIVIAAGASLAPLAWGIRRGGPGLLVQMFMASTAIRGAVALGLAGLAVGVGNYPAVPTFTLLVPYYLALLLVEAASLARGLKSGS